MTLHQEILKLFWHNVKDYFKCPLHLLVHTSIQHRPLPFETILIPPVQNKCVLNCSKNWNAMMCHWQHCTDWCFFYLPFEGVSKKAGAQTGPGFLSVETYPAPHKIPAAAEG